MSSMRTRREAHVFLQLVLPWLILCVAGCAASTPAQHEFVREQDLPEVQADDEILNILNGEADSQDRFPSTVFVALSPDEECSGVLIHPRLVLTAGHCVCRGHEDKGTTTLDSSSCEKNATVRASKGADDFGSYPGTVRLHPDFKVVLQKKKLLLPPHVKVDHLVDGSGRRYVLVDVVVKSQADLAVIALNQPIEGRASPTPLAGTDIHLNDQVITAGYGADVVKNGIVSFTSRAPVRRFGRNSVAKIDGELFVLESPGALPLPGDSGGPCYREESAGMALIGINSRATPGKKAAFTSTYRYRSWLTGELERAAQQKPNAP